MGKTFQVTASSEKVFLNLQRKGEASFVVTNTTGRTVRGTINVKFEGSPLFPWIQVEQPTRAFAPNGQEQFSVNIAVPPGFPPGEVSFLVEAVAEKNPDEDWTASPAVRIEIPAEAPKPPTWLKRFWWIFLVAAVVIGGVVLAIVLTRHPSPVAPQHLDPSPEAPLPRPAPPASPLPPTQPQSAEPQIIVPGLPPGTWANITSSPVAAPAGCGTPQLPCNPNGPNFSWPPDTGQKVCYNDSGEIPCNALPEPGSTLCASTAFCGQDGQYGNDVSTPTWGDNRFLVSGNAREEIVSDIKTGLVWQKEYQFGMAWQYAVDYCARQAASGFAGRNDWHLPDLFELQSLVNYGKSNPASDFPEMQGREFWSSTSTVNVSGGWQFHFGEGWSGPAGKDSAYAVRCVAHQSASPFVDRFYRGEPAAGELVVFDRYTGLLWQITTPPALRWQQALAYCEQLRYAGRSDWRLPNVLELASLRDPSRENPALDTKAFPDLGTSPDEKRFWSSSFYKGSGGSAWVVLFGLPYIAGGGLGESHFVRCVALGP